MGDHGGEGGGVEEGSCWLFYQLIFMIKKCEESAKKEQQEKERLASSDLAVDHPDSSLLLHEQDKTVLMFTLYFQSGRRGSGNCCQVASVLISKGLLFCSLFVYV